VSPRKRPELIEGPDDVPGPTLGEKIEWLIRHRWPDGSVAPATNADVALSITAATGEELSSTGIWKLRTGRGDNPTLKTLTALATFFSVPIGFFGVDEDAAILGDQAALAALLREKGVSRDSLRTLTDLSPAGRRMVEDMIESVARMERERGGSPELPPIASKPNIQLQKSRKLRTVAPGGWLPANVSVRSSDGRLLCSMSLLRNAELGQLNCRIVGP
jgi:hypothetical protein